MDEGGWHGYHEGLKGVKVVLPRKLRQYGYREMSSNREHITLSPPFCVLGETYAESHSAMEKAFSLLPMFTFPNKYVNTRMGSSALDPKNLVENTATLLRGDASSIQRRPTKLPELHDFPRLISASPSGNVNSEIVYNSFKHHWIPALRAKGITKSDKVRLVWDRLGAHESAELLQLFEEENIECTYLCPHSTHVAQPHDLKFFPDMKSKTPHLIDTWAIHFAQQSVFGKLRIEDFPFVIQPSYDAAAQPSRFLEAVRMAGILPFDPDVVLNTFPNNKTFALWKQKIAEPTPPVTPVRSKRSTRGLVSSSSSAASSSSSRAVGINLFSRTKSDVSSNRSPHRTAAFRRQDEHPFKVVVNQRDVFDWEEEANAQELNKLVKEGYIKQSVLDLRRGAKVGRKGDVFTAADVTATREATAAKKKAATEVKHALKKRRATQTKEKMAESKKLVADIAALKKKVKSLERRKKAVLMTQKYTGPFCYCKKDSNSKEMVACSGGGTSKSQALCPGYGWFHFRCVGLTASKAETLDVFRCHVCALRHQFLSPLEPLPDAEGSDSASIEEDDDEREEADEIMSSSEDEEMEQELFVLGENEGDDQ
jgi:hypothetical protein